MKRVVWFVGGVAAGAVGAGRAKKKVRSVAADLAPVQVARRTGERVRRRGHDVAEAVREGRRAMRLKELELRARTQGGATTLAAELDDLGEGAAILVDGEPVEPGQVIVLRQVRDREPGGPRSASRSAGRVRRRA